MSVPLRAGSKKVLISLIGQAGGSYDITFTATVRGLAAAMVAVSVILVVFCLVLVLICWICLCVKSRRYVVKLNWRNHCI